MPSNENSMSSQQTSPSRGPRSPLVTGFYEPDTGSIQYLVADPACSKAAIIDPVWNFDPRHARTNTHSADEILTFGHEHGLTVEWILDTHPHADHFTAGAYLGEKLGAPHAIGEKVREAAALWRNFYNEPKAFDIGKAYDRLLADGDTFRIGALPVRVMLSPGHTLASITYVVGDDSAFVHDTLMMPDSGTSRADFPGGDAATLYRSIRNILALPPQTRLFVGHDYGKGGRAPQWEATVAEQKASNIHVKDGISEAEFEKIRTARDKTLPLPDRMLYALQVNLRGGRLPAPEDDGHSYFRIPANRF
jgi:glyoxylase-like metal-dependent hydrolase (beta-lactamase superfamily II)